MNVVSEMNANDHSSACFNRQECLSDVRHKFRQRHIGFLIRRGVKIKALALITLFGMAVTGCANSSEQSLGKSEVLVAKAEADLNNSYKYGTKGDNRFHSKVLPCVKYAIISGRLTQSTSSEDGFSTAQLVLNKAGRSRSDFEATKNIDLRQRSRFIFPTHLDDGLWDLSWVYSVKTQGDVSEKWRNVSNQKQKPLKLTSENIVEGEGERIYDVDLPSEMVTDLGDSDLIEIALHITGSNVGFEEIEAQLPKNDNYPGYVTLCPGAELLVPIVLNGEL